jgi:hypothetical protein
MIKYFISFLVSSFLPLFAMQQGLEQQFQKDLLQAIEQSSTRQEVQGWLDTLKGLREYHQFFSNPTTQETINVLVTEKFGPEKPKQAIGPQAETSLLDFLPRELLKELHHYNLYNLMKAEIEEAVSLQDALDRLEQFGKLNKSEFNTLGKVAPVIEALFQKFGARGRIWYPRSSIAQKLSAFAPGAKIWLAEQAKKADDEKALIKAAGNNDIKKVKELLAKGVNPNTLYTDYRVGEDTGEAIFHASPLWLASNRMPNLVRLLLEYGANPNAVGGTDGMPAFMVSTFFNDDPDLVRLFLSKGADINVTYKSPKGKIETVLDIARRAAGNSEAKEAIIKEFKAKMEAKK